MGAYKVIDSTDTDVTISCGCRGKKNVTLQVEHLKRMSDENHDLIEAGKAAGIPRNHNPRKVLQIAVDWALEHGHIEQKPKGW